MTNAEMLRRAHHMQTLGQVEEAESLLASLSGEISIQDIEMAYLQVWCALERNQWEEVVQRVCQPPFVDDISAAEAWLVEGSVRRRRPGALLKLAGMASTLGYPQEAIAHITHCLRLLDERRMNIPEVRSLAHTALGGLALATGDGAVAITQYETALQISAQDPTHPLLATLYKGLCEAFFQQKLFSQALTYGQQCLHLPDFAQKEAFFLLLSQICTALQDLAQADAYAQQAWHLAHKACHPLEMAKAWLAQAEVRYEQGRFSDARSCCAQALALPEVAQEMHLQARLAWLCGKIAEAEWRDSQDVSSLAEGALSWYEQAQRAFAELEKTTDLAAVLICQARLLEARGETAQALAAWKRAYELTGNHAEVSSYS